MRWLAGLVLALGVLAAGMGGAQQAPGRIALVIGNSAYRTAGWELANPVNDARLMAERLKPLGFDVTLLEDADEDQLGRAVNTFGARLRAEGAQAVGFFYYAGHGVEHDGANLLIPVDVTARTVDELRTQAVPLSFVLRDMARADNGVNFVVLDACRNLPLPSGQRTGPAGGLAVDEAPNVLIAYATRPGQVAYDNPGEGNSIFTKTLADAFAENPSERVVNLFAQAQSRVFKARAEQRPEFRSGLLRDPDFRFREPPAAPVGAVLAPATTPKLAPNAPTTPGTVFRDCEVCPEMVVIPAGRFQMGSTAPPERTSRNYPILTETSGAPRMVEIERPFALGVTEITRGDWMNCVETDDPPGCRDIADSRPFANADERNRAPITNVSRPEIMRYVTWLNRQAGGNLYRLPTEAEWEYAARANANGTYDQSYPWGADASHEYANYGKDGESGGRSLGRDKWEWEAAPVRSFPANAFGLFDMHGNVEEIVQDCHPPRAGQPRTDCSQPMTKGGGYTSRPVEMRSAARGRVHNERINWAGFRVARTIANRTEPAMPTQP